MMMNKTFPADKIFYTTGRLTSEMVIKTVLMAIPIFVSRSGFTESGVSLAKEANLTLVGRANDVSNLVGVSDAKTITVSGNPAASSAQSNFYNGSFLFDGTGDYLTTSSTGTDMTVGSGDFTIELWVYFNSLSGTPLLVSAGTGGFSVGANPSGEIIMYRNGAGGWG